jgi:phosphatidylserine/phosphatidylglycerophosphate/cardiolipin synthase-like enzyme
MTIIYNPSFSPGWSCLDLTQSILATATVSLDIAMYQFTDSKVWELLKLTLARGIPTRLLLDRQSSRRWSAIWIRFLMWNSYANLTVRISKTTGLMHHSFLVTGNGIALTGSYQWTAVGRKRNNENLVMLTDPIIVPVYKYRFDTLWLLNA